MIKNLFGFVLLLSSLAIAQQTLPVEIVSFNGYAYADGTVDLDWQTVTESQNAGFNVERKDSISDWKAIVFIMGHGTSSTPHSYYYTDQVPTGGTYSYRLHQYDNGGASHIYEKIVTVAVPMPTMKVSSFSIAQEGELATIMWETKSEFKNKSFSLQRKDVVDTVWKTLTTMPGAGTTFILNSYLYNDFLTAPGKYFYRLLYTNEDSVTTIYPTILEAEILPSFTKIALFSVKLNGRTALLQWQTQYEYNNLGFAVQRKDSSAMVWKTIGTKAGSASSYVPIMYSLYDSMLLQGTYSYRLIQYAEDSTANVYDSVRTIFVTITSAFIQKNVPREFALYQNYPNPFNPVTTITYQIPLATSSDSPFTKSEASKASGGFVTLKIYDMLGRELATLVNEEKTPGTYSVVFDASYLPSGIYFYSLRAGNFSETKRMLLVK